MKPRTKMRTALLLGAILLLASLAEGGQIPDGSDPAQLDEIVANDGAWVDLTPVPNPLPARRAHSLVYDSLRDRLVLFGGRDGSTVFNDVWVLPLSGGAEWSALSPAGTPIPAKYAHTAIYDPARDCMVVYGGHGGGSLDVWELTFSGTPTWNKFTPSPSPSIRAYHTAIYDFRRDRMVVFGGDQLGDYVNDVWELSLSTRVWSLITPLGGPPSKRYMHSAIYDPTRDRMVMFGGDGPTFRNDVWELTFVGPPTWTDVAPAGTPPAMRRGHAAIYDPVRDRMIVHGGANHTVAYGDVWALSLSGGHVWSPLSPAGVTPPARWQSRSIYDPIRDRDVIVAGWSDVATFFNDVPSILWGTPVGVEPGASVVPSALELSQPQPNPSQGESVLAFTLESPGNVTLDIFDAKGRHIRRVADAWFTAGRQESRWQGDDDEGHAIEPGLYFMRVKYRGMQKTRKLVRI